MLGIPSPIERARLFCAAVGLDKTSLNVGLNRSWQLHHFIADGVWDAAAIGVGIARSGRSPYNPNATNFWIRTLDRDQAFEAARVILFHSSLRHDHRWLQALPKEPP